MVNLGNVLFENREYEDAKKVLERIIKILPSSGKLTLSLTYQALGEYEKAITVLRLKVNEVP